MKKVTLIKVASILLVSAAFLAACSTKKDSNATNTSNIKVNATGFPIVNKKLTISLMAPNTGMADWKNMPTLTDYAKETNINLKSNTVPMSDFSTKLNLAFASQDLSDIIYAAGTDNLTPANETTYGSQGQLLPLEKLIPKYAPNLEKLLKADPSIRKSITTPDGHIYSLPLISRNATAIWPMGPMWYNGAWLKKLNVTTLPKTTDEFYDLMMRFKNDDPNGNGQQDEIPLTDSKLTSIRPWMMSAFGMLAQGVENDNGKVVYTPTTDRYKTYLTFMNKMIRMAY